MGWLVCGLVLGCGEAERVPSASAPMQAVADAVPMMRASTSAPESGAAPIAGADSPARPPKTPPSVPPPRDASMDTPAPAPDALVPAENTADAGPQPEMGRLRVAGDRCPEGPFGDPLRGIGMPRRVMGGFTFTEGAVWIEGEQAFFFTEIDRPAITGRIYKYAPASGGVELWNDEVAANGLAVDQQGMMLAGAQDKQQVSRIDPKTKARSEVPGGSTYEGVVYNSPNDIVVRSDGSIYFTDSEYQRGGRPGQSPILGVYWISPDGVTTRFDVRNKPNGINLSPDTKWLYVSITDGSDSMKRYPIGVDGKPGPGETFIMPNSDGMAMDCAGNLYLTQPWGNGSPVIVYSPEGRRLGQIGPFGAGTFNVAFGGEDGRLMVVCSGDSIYEVSVSVPGFPN